MATSLSVLAKTTTPAIGKADIRGSVAIAVFGLAITIAYAVQSTITFVGGVVLCLLFVLNYRRLLRVDPRDTTRGLLVLALFVPAFFKPGHGFSPIFYLFATAVSFATAYVISRFSATAIYRASTIIYWVLAVLVALVLVIYWDSPAPFGEVIEGSSTNAIPAYMIIVQLLLCVTTFVVTGRAPVLTPVITFLIAFFGSGRGSLVVASLLVIGSLIINLFPRHGSFFYRVVLFTMSLVAMALLVIYADEIYDYVSRLTKLSVGIADQNRMEILTAYLSTITPYTFFFGSEYQGTIIDIQYEGNPHISFIRTHSFFGIFVMLMALFSPLVVLFSRARWALKLPVFFFVSLAVVRAGSEPILFPTLLDVFYFLMILVFFRARAFSEGRV